MNEARVCEPFAAVLRAQRDAFNARFSAAHRQHPTLDADQFMSVLVQVIDPWVRATHATRPECVSHVVNAGYDVALEWVAQALVGPSSKYPRIAHGLAVLLPQAAALVADQPRYGVACLTNALHQVETTPRARTDEWIVDLQRMLPSVSDLGTLLKVGQVCAWRAGLAHYRRGALQVLSELPENVACGLLGDDVSSGFANTRARLERDPWFVPGRVDEAPRAVGGVGAFRGFGGLFTEPPRVERSGSDVLVRSGDAGWLLYADAYGATFHRATPEELKPSVEDPRLPVGITVEKEQLRVGTRVVPLPIRGQVTSIVCTSTTCFVTSSMTHAVALIALPSA